MHGLDFDIAHLLAGSLVLVSFMMIYQDRIYSLLNTFALQAVLLALAVAWQAWIQGAHRAVLSALMSLERLAAWRARAEAETDDLSGRTPALLIAALSARPLLGAVVAEAETGAVEALLHEAGAEAVARRHRLRPADLDQRIVHGQWWSFRRGRPGRVLHEDRPEPGKEAGQAVPVGASPG